MYSTEVTPEWYETLNGYINVVSKKEDIRGSHAICIEGNVTIDQQQCFGFANSWGKHWGDSGYGYFSHEHYNRFIIEAWVMPICGYVIPLINQSGIVCLEWKWSLTDSIGVHGREIIDAKTNDRLAWAFCVRRDGYLDVDEFFVWPTERGKGYGKQLAAMVLKLAKQLRSPIRLWVSFTDTEETCFSDTEKAAKLLDVKLGESPVPWAHLCGTKNPLPINLDRRRPVRPASILEWLRPKDEAPEENPIEYEISFGTNRKQASNSKSPNNFSNERGSSLILGRCKVRVPQTHRFGNTGRNWLRFFRRIDGNRLELLETEILDIADFCNSEKKNFNREPQNLLYVHGYNVSFDDAIKEAAQFGVDLKIPGKTFVFSWPSAASFGRYSADEASIEASIPFLEQFVALLRSRFSDVPLNVLVHSMGSRAAIRLLAKLAGEPISSQVAPIGQVIFAAPDVDHEVFANSVAQIASISKRTTLYATRGDFALQASEFLHKYPRAGLFPPTLAAEGFDTVLVEDFDLFTLGHSYHSKASDVLHDMFHLIHHDSSPCNRPAIKEAKSKDGKVFWKLPLS